MNRRTAMKVRNGKVLRKNWTELTPNYYDTEMPELVIDRRRRAGDIGISWGRNNTEILLSVYRNGDALVSLLTFYTGQ